MEDSKIQHMIRDFEAARHTTDDDVEFWFARELQALLGYTKWDNFLEVTQKAQEACTKSKNVVSYHFADVSKMVSVGSGAQREVADIMLTRYACYLIAQNGDPRKEKIAFAQTYFAVQTRKFELIQDRLALQERLFARKKLSETEKELSRIIFEQTHSDKNFALIRSQGDTALFGRTTKDMKIKRGIKASQPLADFMPTVLLKAKDLASEITIYNSKYHHMSMGQEISHEHITNNTSVRKTLISRGITPESISPEQDIKKLERKLNAEGQKLLSKRGTTKKR